MGLGASNAHQFCTPSAVGQVYAAREATEVIERLILRVIQIEAEVMRLSRLTEDCLMEAAGLRAQIIAMKVQHPSSPLLVETGGRYKNGDAKTELTGYFERAFDAKGLAMKISNPAARRSD